MVGQVSGVGQDGNRVEPATPATMTPPTKGTTPKEIIGNQMTFWQQAAEAWVREPEDGVRRQALKIAETGRKTAPHTWAAFAAAWSGGSMTLDAQSVPPPAHLTGACVRICVLNALATVPARDRARHIAGCIAGALSLLGATPSRPVRQQGR